MFGLGQGAPPGSVEREFDRAEQGIPVMFFPDFHALVDEFVTQMWCEHFDEVIEEFPQIHVPPQHYLGDTGVEQMTGIQRDEVDIGEFSTLSDFAQADGHAQARAAKRRYQVPTVSLNDLLRRHGAPAEPDYLSIDMEGSEFAILQELDFTRFHFKVITCEHNHTPMREPIRRLLESAGYQRRHEKLSRFDDWYVRVR